jgi:hypothetical protein
LLIDFGESIAVATKALGRDKLGNPAWCAPEIMKGDPYTEKADVFSMGIVMWEIISRQLPYSEYSVSKSTFMSQFEDAIIFGLRPTIPKGIYFIINYNNILLECPPDLAQIIKDCWESDPDLRPSMDDILIILNHLLNNLPQCITQSVTSSLKLEITPQQLNLSSRVNRDSKYYQQQQQSLQPENNTTSAPSLEGALLRPGVRPTSSTTTGTSNQPNVPSRAPRITPSKSPLQPSQHPIANPSQPTIPSQPIIPARPSPPPRIRVESKTMSSGTANTTTNSPNTSTPNTSNPNTSNPSTNAPIGGSFLGKAPNGVGKNAVKVLPMLPKEDENK